MHDAVGATCAMRRASRQSSVVVEMVMQPVTPARAAAARVWSTLPAKSGKVRWQWVSITGEGYGEPGVIVCGQVCGKGGSGKCELGSRESGVGSRGQDDRRVACAAWTIAAWWVVVAVLGVAGVCRAARCRCR